ncbi:MAG TPA: hypothetical protein VGC99_10340 [Candidatus Tectomicrobia bacterium]
MKDCSAGYLSFLIELPEDVSQALQERWGDVSRRTLEAIAREGYPTT